MAEANREEEEDEEDEEDEVVEKAVPLAMEDAEGIAAADDDGMGSGLEDEDLCRSSEDLCCWRNSAADPVGDADDGVIGGSLWKDITLEVFDAFTIVVQIVLVLSCQLQKSEIGRSH